jgi:carbonic anhydrase
MDHASPLPDHLVARYRAWQARRSPEDVAAYAGAALQQNPKAMIITCCDSRV